MHFLGLRFFGVERTGPREEQIGSRREKSHLLTRAKVRRMGKKRGELEQGRKKHEEWIDFRVRILSGRGWWSESRDKKGLEIDGIGFVSLSLFIYVCMYVRMCVCA